MKQFIIVSLVHVFIVALAFGYSGGPPDGSCGIPPTNINCTACHSSFPVNSGDGTLDLQAPTVYIPGTTYDLTVDLTDAGQTRWGFELAVLKNTLEQGGTLVVTDPTNTQLSDNPDPGPDFLKQTSDGTFAGNPNGGLWSFQWIAPEAATGTLTFYVAGNAANNNGSTNGDYIYTITATVDEGSGVFGEDPVPLSIELLRNYPNPFNPTTTVEFSLMQSGNVRLDVYNLLGQQVKSLWEGWMSQGLHSIRLDGSDLASGIYFTILRTPVGQKIHVMHLQK